jgi:predicted ester cyclase
MPTEENKTAIRRMVENFNRRDLAFIDQTFSPHFVLHTARTSGWPRGLEGARKMFTTMLTTSPNIQATIEDIVAEGDKIAVRWTFQGTHSGESPFSGSPTGETFTMVSIAIYRFVDGKITEDWGVDARWQTGKPWE